MNPRFHFSLLACLLLPGLVRAHPVPRDQYDRIIDVRFQPAEKPGDIRVEVHFRLEVDPQTVVLRDMKPYQKEIDLNKISKRIDYFNEFTRIYADIYGRNFFNRVNGKELDWKCVKRSASFEDEKGMPLDHLRCDFWYESHFTPQKDENQFFIKDLNYQDHPGKIQLTFLNESQARLTKVTAPDPKLLEMPFEERGPDEESALRVVRLKFHLPETVARTADATRAEDSTSTADTGGTLSNLRDGQGNFSLLRLFMTDYGLTLLLLMSAVIGGLHALTPGHGKTMVAAYLVGERGTVWHAVYLGIVTTLTHTGAVLVIAGVLQFVAQDASKETERNIQTGLGLVMGLAILGLGLFLLLQRLAGRADHVHIGGGHHHHHHHHHGHVHAHTPESVVPADATQGRGRFTWWGLTILGITGGLIPCWDAIALLGAAVGMNLFWLALPMLLAFSAGLASVLVLIGIAVVKFRDVLGSSWGEGKFIRALPILSAIVVTLMGFWICYEAVHGAGL